RSGEYEARLDPAGAYAARGKRFGPDSARRARRGAGRRTRAPRRPAAGKRAWRILPVCPVQALSSRSAHPDTGFSGGRSLARYNLVHGPPELIGVLTAQVADTRDADPLHLSRMLDADPPQQRELARGAR